MVDVRVHAAFTPGHGISRICVYPKPVMKTVTITAALDSRP